MATAKKAAAKPKPKPVEIEAEPGPEVAAGDLPSPTTVHVDSRGRRVRVQKGDG